MSALHNDPIQGHLEDGRPVLIMGLAGDREFLVCLPDGSPEIKHISEVTYDWRFDPNATEVIQLEQGPTTIPAPRWRDLDEMEPPPPAV